MDRSEMSASGADAARVTTFSEMIQAYQGNERFIVDLAAPALELMLWPYFAFCFLLDNGHSLPGCSRPALMEDYLNKGYGFSSPYLSTSMANLPAMSVWASNYLIVAPSGVSAFWAAHDLPFGLTVIKPFPGGRAVFFLAGHGGTPADEYLSMLPLLHRFIDFFYGKMFQLRLHAEAFVDVSAHLRRSPKTRAGLRGNRDAFESALGSNGNSLAELVKLLPRTFVLNKLETDCWLAFRLGGSLEKAAEYLNTALCTVQSCFASLQTRLHRATLADTFSYLEDLNAVGLLQFHTESALIQRGT